MKNCVQNHWKNSETSRIGFDKNYTMKNTTLNNLKGKITLLLALGLLSLSLPAQQIKELGSYIDELNASGDPGKVAVAAHIVSLTTDLNPTVYVGSTISSNGTDAPIRAIVKGNAVSKLTVNNSLYSGVEMIIIRLRSAADLSFQLNLNTLESFPVLKTVVFQCEFECSIDDLTPLFLPNPDITVLYNISIAS